MKREIELLAPGGDIDSIKAAIVAGANAIYCGLARFNARNRAENISFEDLNGILRLAHESNCKVFITLNIIIIENEISALIQLLNKLINTKIDGVIVQDLGLFYLLSKYFSGLNIHASTQLTTHNVGQIKFLSRLSATRANLSRELSLGEIKELTLTGHQHGVLTEVFVHGSYCICFSGICYFSSVNGANSGNRGRCSQPCRGQFLTTAQGKDFPLNLKDNSAYYDLKELSDTGVDSIKIEGRIKKFHYVYTVVDSYRKQLQSFYADNELHLDNKDLYTVFNRDFSNGFLKGDINKHMFIDNPRDNSALHYSKINGVAFAENTEKAKQEIYDLKTKIIANVTKRIEQLSIAKVPLVITISGKAGAPLKVVVKTDKDSWVVLSNINLVNSKGYQTNISQGQKSQKQGNDKSNGQCLNHELLLIRFKSLYDTEYFNKDFKTDNLQSDLFIPFKELTRIKNKIYFILNDSREYVYPIDVPRLSRLRQVKIQPTLSLLISSQNDLPLSRETSADIYFQLPNSLKGNRLEFIDLFVKNKKLIPWFPSVLIGEDYHAAVEFLQQVQPKRIVTNNTGIAYEAYQGGIPWIAGPYLNIVNSFSLLCLKEKFNCYGSFISNELKKIQITGLKRPDDFKLYYRIYHPIVLITSRQCLFHQVTGCKKSKIDDACIQQCEKSTSITNLKNSSLLIKKLKGNYHSIYHETNFLNTDIATDLPDLFSSFFVDLRDIKTDTKIKIDKLKLVQLFENHLKGKPNSTEELRHRISPTTNNPYVNGI